MLEKGLVSVIVNCFNGEKYLKSAIDSILAQTYKNFEVIFWDNASTDGTKRIIDSYKDKRIKYFRSESTVKVYAARNLALAKCNGEFVAFLDSDDLWLPTKLEKQIPLFSDTEVGLVFSDSLFFTNNGKKRNNYSKGYPKTGYCFDELLKDYHLDIETVVLRHSLLLNNNLKFNDLFNCVGDADLFISVSLISKISMVKEVLAKWRIHNESITATQKEKFITEERDIIMKYRKKFRGSLVDHSKSLKSWENRLDIRELLLTWEKKGRQNSEKKFYLIKNSIFFSFFSF